VLSVVSVAAACGARLAVHVQLAMAQPKCGVIGQTYSIAVIRTGPSPNVPWKACAKSNSFHWHSCSLQFCSHHHPILAQIPVRHHIVPPSRLPPQQWTQTSLSQSPQSPRT
jgi:hypothetical protein